MDKPRYLISTQSYRHEYDSGREIPTQYGYLVETDLRGWMRLLKIPSPTYSPYGERIKTGLRGLCMWNAKIYITTWNAVHMIDYATFQVERSASHPLMSDLHGLYVDRQGIWVTSSLIDSVLHFDSDFQLRKVLALPETPVYSLHKRRRISRDRDYRFRGKTHRGFLHFHANHVTGYGDDYVLVTGSGSGKARGRLLQICRNTLEYQIWLGGLHSPHDGVFIHPDCFAVTETGTSSIALVDPTIRIPTRYYLQLAQIPGLHRLFGARIKRRLPLEVKEGQQFWTRGLCVNDRGNLLVGKSVWQGDNRLASVVELTLDGETVNEYMIKIPDYPECRIFQIIMAQPPSVEVKVE